jgi:hypothetical protein
MINNITWIHILLGVGTPLLESDQFIQCIPDNWFLNIRGFLLKIKAKILIRGLWQPKLLRQDDFFIMEKIDQLNPSKRDAIIINNWRVYLQVLTLSDITNAAGDRISGEIYNRNQVHKWSSKSRLKWPHQKMPPISVSTTL